MINFNEELKRYKPSLEVDNIEESIKSNDLTDIMDMLHLIYNKEIKKNNKTE